MKWCTVVVGKVAVAISKSLDISKAVMNSSVLSSPLGLLYACHARVNMSCEITVSVLSFTCAYRYTAVCIVNWSTSPLCSRTTTIHTSRPFRTNKYQTLSSTFARNVSCMRGRTYTKAGFHINIFNHRPRHPQDRHVPLLLSPGCSLPKTEKTQKTDRRLSAREETLPNKAVAYHHPSRSLFLPGLHTYSLGPSRVTSIRGGSHHEIGASLTAPIPSVGCVVRSCCEAWHGDTSRLRC